MESVFNLSNSLITTAIIFTKEVGAGESFVGLVAGQLGFLGLVLYLSFFILCSRYLMSIKISQPNHYRNVMIGCYLLGLFVSTFLTESSLGFLSVANGMILTGYFVSRKQIYPEN